MRWLCALILLAACGRDRDPPKPAPMQLMQKHSPTGVLADLQSLAVDEPGGATVRLGDRLRDVTVLAFWASWCHPCMEELPQLDRYVAQQTDKRVAVLAINLDETSDRTAALAAIDTLKLHVPVLLDPTGATYRVVFPKSDGVTIPAIAVIGADGYETDDGYEQVTDAQYIAALKYRVDKHLH